MDDTIIKQNRENVQRFLQKSVQKIRNIFSHRRKRKSEIKRGIEILTQNFEKIFEKPLDNGIFLWYNLTCSAKEIRWCRT